MTIKINLSNTSITVQENGTLEEIARKYFTGNEEVKSIEILDADNNTFSNEYFKRTPLEIFRASKEDIEEFELYYNICQRFSVEYFKGQAENNIVTCGLCRIA